MPTKYYEEHIRKVPRRQPPAADNNIIISDNDDAVKDYECSYCSHIIHTRKTDGEICCPNCTNEFSISNARKKSKLEVPRGRNTEVYAAITPDPNEPYYRKKEPELKGGFKVLQQKGIRITRYEEGVG